MKELIYTLRVLWYKESYFKLITAGWGISLLVTFFQFAGSKSSAMVGSVETSYFLFSTGNLIFMIFTYTLPIISSLIYADCLLDDQRIRNQLYMRGRRNKFHIAYLFNSFFSSFFFYLFTLLMALLFTYLMLRNNGNMLDEGVYMFNVSNTKLLEMVLPSYDLYLNNNTIRIFMYIIIISIYAGTCGWITYAASLITNKKIIIYISPFLFTVILQLICSFASSDLYVQKMINPHGGVSMNPLIYIVIYAIACFILCNVIYIVKGYKEESVCKP